MAQVQMLLKLLEGKKTHLLVLMAVVLYLFGVIESPDGLDFSQINSNDLMKVVLMGIVSSVKAGFNRVEKKGG